MLNKPKMYTKMNCEGNKEHIIELNITRLTSSIIWIASMLIRNRTSIFIAASTTLLALCTLFCHQSAFTKELFQLVGIENNETDGKYSRVCQRYSPLSPDICLWRRDAKPMPFSFFHEKGVIAVESQAVQETMVVRNHRYHLPIDHQDLSSEMQASLKLAHDMSAQGKQDKALRILEHALALNPHHPDVLNEYGEYLEKTKSDVVLAEHMYGRALVVSPSHSRAVANRQRTLPLVEEIDRERFERIDRKLDILIRVPDGHPGLRRAVHESYFRHLYHTTAMEGNTFTLSQTRSFVETRVVIGGKSIIEHNEILGMEAAYQLLNSSLIRRVGKNTVSDISDIHRRVLGFVDPLHAGEFRRTQVYVGDFVPPSPSDVQQLVEEFIAWLNAEETSGQLHPIELAALAHYKLVYIHPFYDGNGRTSRLLMNLVLMRAGFPPVYIPVEDKQEYYRHLEAANVGDVRPFVRFIARCVERTIEEFLYVSVENINRTFPEIARLHEKTVRQNYERITVSPPV